MQLLTILNRIIFPGIQIVFELQEFSLRLILLTNSLLVQLLAVLHHILFPGQRLADLPGRIARSRQALEARATKWVTAAQKKFQVRRETSMREVVGRAGSCHCLLQVRVALVLASFWWQIEREGSRRKGKEAGGGDRGEDGCEGLGSVPDLLRVG